MEEYIDFKKKMRAYVDAQAVSPKSLVLTQEKYEAICHHLLNKEVKVDPHFKHWVKIRKFRIMDVPSFLSGLEMTLVVPANEEKTQGDDAPKFLTVVHAGQVFEVVSWVHDLELKHGGYKKVLDYVQKHFFGITRGFVQEYCKCCPLCQQNGKPQTRPITSHKFLGRVQIDLVDMRHLPDGDFNYIGHFEDHFSNFHVLFPLKTNGPAEVATELEHRVLAYFGPPKIFHSDNGKEFVDQLIWALSERWEGDIPFENGESRNSKSHPLARKDTESIENMMTTIKQEENIGDDETGYPWASWLPRIMFSMNSVKQDSTKEMPYHVVFGRSAPPVVFPGAKEHCICEVKIEDCFEAPEPGLM